MRIKGENMPKDRKQQLFDVKMEINKLALELDLPQDMVVKALELAKIYIEKFPQTHVKTLVAGLIVIVSKQSVYRISQKRICDMVDISLTSLITTIKRLEKILQPS